MARSSACQFDVWPRAVNVALGVWLFISAFLFPEDSPDGRGRSIR